MTPQEITLTGTPAPVDSRVLETLTASYGYNQEVSLRIGNEVIILDQNERAKLARFLVLRTDKGAIHNARIIVNQAEARRNLANTYRQRARTLALVYINRPMGNDNEAYWDAVDLTVGMYLEEADKLDQRADRMSRKPKTTNGTDET